MATATTRSMVLVALYLAVQLIQGAFSLNTVCYHDVGGVQHVSADGGPCGVVSPNSPFYSCCTVGDQCLDDGLCHYTHDPPVGSNTTGYYVGGCNDPSLADPSCSTGCNELQYPDVVFNSTSKEWFCCGAVGTNIKCQNPTTVTVSAKVFASIATTYVVPSQVATTAASKTSGSASITSTHSSFPTTTTANPGAKKSKSSTPVGAIVGGVVGGVAVIALLVGGWLFWRRRMISRGRNAVMPSENGFGNVPVEKSTDSERTELQAIENPVEMSAQEGDSLVKHKVPFEEPSELPS